LNPKLQQVIQSIKRLGS